MGVIDDILGTLSDDAVVEDIRMCAFWTAVVADSGTRRCGLASTLRADPHESDVFVANSGNLLERSARQLAELVRSESPLEASIGMAAINALIAVDPGVCVEVNGADLALQRAGGRRVAIVGHFPFVEAFRATAEECWVLEQRPKQGDLPAEAAGEVVPKADVLVLTGTSVMNHTFEQLVSLRAPGAFVVVLGPSTPLSPVLFDYGVDVIAGSVVADVGTMLRYISQGATFRQVRGVKRVSMVAPR